MPRYSASTREHMSRLLADGGPVGNIRRRHSATYLAEDVKQSEERANRKGLTPEQQQRADTEAEAARHRRRHW